jgi:CheY-like chemotaxis protein
MSATVLFIDDDRRFIRLYAEAAKELGLRVECRHGVDDALQYLREGNPADVIVWDMMMAPGISLAHADTRGGIATGRFLFKEMQERRPRAAFILLTNLGEGDPESSYLGQQRAVRFKTETSPEELAAVIHKIALDGDPGEGGVG